MKTFNVDITKPYKKTYFRKDTCTLHASFDMANSIIIVGLFYIDAPSTKMLA